MTIKNETLRNKLLAKKDFLVDKITPLSEELDMVNGMLAQLDAYDNKKIVAAENKLGITEERKE